MNTITNDEQARSARGVPFSWPPIVVGMVDPLRMGRVQ